MSPPEPAHIAAEIERLLASVATDGDAPTAARARELAQLILSLYGAGLERILDIVRGESHDAVAVLDKLAADPLVSSLLALHELHPHPAAQRIGRALAAISPLFPAGTEVTVVAAAGDRAHVQVSRPPAAQTQQAGVRRAIERAIQDAAPEITDVRIDGLPDALLQIMRSPAAAAPR